MCDSTNDRCLCGPGEPECGDGEYCEDEKCSGKIIKILPFDATINLKLSSIVVIHNQYNPLLHLFLEVDGSWEEWGEWFPCPGCGKELKKRKRKCNLKGNGRPCDGEAEEIESGKNGLFDN